MAVCEVSKLISSFLEASEFLLPTLQDRLLNWLAWSNCYSQVCLFMINKHAKYCFNWILFTIQLMLANLLRIHRQPKIFGTKALLLLLDLIFYPIHKLMFCV